MKTRSLAVFLIGFLAVAGVQAGESIRLDASSDASAKSSWKRMTESVSREKQQQLLVAMLQINLAGVNSAYEVAGNPELQHPSITRIKDRIAGLNADEIIAMGNRVSTFQAEVKH